MKNSLRNPILVILLCIAAVAVIGGGYYAFAKNKEKDAEPLPQLVTSSPDPIREEPVNTVKNASSVGLVIRKISVDSFEGSKPVISNETVVASEGRSFYSSDSLKPYITKPIFTLAKINSIGNIDLGYSDEVHFLVNNNVDEQAANPFELKKGDEQCFVTTWDGSGYKFCVSLR